MNDKQSQEFQELTNLESQGTIEDSQKERLEELKTLKDLTEKTVDFNKKSKDFESAIAQKEHFREKAEKAESERKALEDKLNKGNGGKSLDVGDYIDISASLEGLDQREKERLAKEHKLTGRPLAEIRKDDDFLLWQSAYRQKAEKEKSQLTPTNKQPDNDGPISLEEALNNAQSEGERADLLRDNLGYSVDNKPRADRVIIR